MSSLALVERVVAIRADRGKDAPGGRWSYGSGCLVAGTMVLTAAHVVAGAHQAWVRTADSTEHIAILDPRFAGDPAE